ncbi:Leucyl/phenylalanyl-tRNA--protein transferase [Vibrio stylophorae]|uniref:Leucyl/phenylalanyl-tRNA--protein transferase n=1 Tax=Vibrio stylophorae TaxID=659351 RepID=A0ABM8ZSS9_9VIBR|nr:leucyl/phenylalanyl-tRNA--protein transferase [Vibrio stylophorae]CAH0533367.1 Leucyl/phenylalanyl-tRNA--protein transferase [Vibrio stylophorae]
MYLTELSPHHVQFPIPDQALSEPDGLLAIGGDLRPERLIEAYRHGIFPWYNQGEPILWWSPSTRALFDPCTPYLSRSSHKFQRKAQYVVTINCDFAGVIAGCRHRPNTGTWITKEIAQAYIYLHHLGHAHSIEVWHQDQLVGGFYGIACGAMFCGESMFSRATNASKIALWAFSHHFAKHGGHWIDCQMENPHLMSLGAQLMPRRQYLDILMQTREQALPASVYHQQQLAFPGASHAN